MRDGLPEPVKVGGYWEEPVKSYYFQKCQAGLDQSLHRIRPYIDREYDRHISICSNLELLPASLFGAVRAAGAQYVFVGLV